MALTEVIVPSIWTTDPKSSTAHKTTIAHTSIEVTVSEIAIEQDGTSSGSDQLEVLLPVLRQLLRQSTLLPTDNFFALAGDSLVAMQLVTKLRKQGYKLTVKDVLQSPNFVELSKKMVVRKSLSHDPYSPFCLLDSTEKEPLMLQASHQCNIQSQDIHDIMPCTPLQEGLVALSMQNPSLYVSREVFQLHSHLNIPELQAAISKVASATSMLRTRFFFTPSNNIMQLITKTSPPCDIVSSELSEYLTQDKLSVMSVHEAMNRICIVVDPTNNESHLVWTAHHAASDGYSMRLVLDDIVRKYHDKSDTSSLISLGPFIRQLQRLKGGDALTFWKNRLSTAIAPSYPALPGVNYQCVATESLSRKIPLDRSATNFTLFNYLKATWALLLSKYENSKTVSFATISNGRNVPLTDIEKVAGPTFAAVPVLIDLTEHTKTTSLLRSIQSHATAAIPFEQIGLQNIIAADHTLKPLVSFRTQLILQDADLTTRNHNKVIQYDTYRTDRSLSYPLTLACEPKNDGILIEAIYDRHTISERQIGRLLAQFEHVLQQLIHSTSRQDAELDELTFCTEQDLREMRSQVNLPIPAVEPLTVQELVQIQSDRAPNSLAVCSTDATLTYKELSIYSDNLAAHIQSVTGGRPMRVVMCLEKSVWAAVAHLAILKAGCACVPIPFADPTQREREIVASVQSSIVLASPYYAASFLSLVDHVFLVNSAVIRRLPTCKHFLSSTDVHAEAVVFHTSGSTGKAKGVVHTHTSMAFTLQHIVRAFNYTSRSRTLHFAAFTFDVSWDSLFATLLAGGTVCMPSEVERIDHLARVVNDLAVNTMHLTPTVSRLLTPAEVPCLKRLFIGGEPFTPTDAARWADHVELRSTYGPTECAIDSTMSLQPLNANSPSSTIGKPFNCAVWVTLPDDHNRLAPLGAIGELLIEGQSIAREYLNQPELTALAYVSNPKWVADSASVPRRFYKTGDLVTIDSSGEIHYMYRKDSQIKIRGLRVELGEIEYQVEKALPPGAEVVVDIIPLGNDETDRTDKLVAFYTVPESEANTALDLMAVINPI